MSLFANAAKVAPKKTAAAKSKKNEVTLPGLRHVAMIDALVKSLGTLKNTLSKEIKDEAFDIFYGEVTDSGKTPVSFRGLDGDASASIEMRKKASNIALNDDEVALFATVGIVPTEAVIVQEMFGFNPSYINDSAMLDTISAALEPLIAAGKLPADLIMKQDKVSKKVVTDETFEAACRLKDKLPREVLEAMTSMAIKPKLEVTDLSAIFEEVKDMIGTVSAE